MVFKDKMYEIQNAIVQFESLELIDLDRDFAVFKFKNIQIKANNA